MATLTTKYSIGDVVWYATTTTERKQHPCPDCLGTREWKAIAPSGREYKFACPRCGGGYSGNSDTSLSYTASVGRASKLTIGQVRAVVGGDGNSWEKPASYMCRETGIGGGSVYDEDSLYPSEAEALAAAKVKADLNNSQIDWIVKQYEKSLSVSDYQLADADLKTKYDELHRAQSKIRYIIDDLRNCDTIEDVKSELDRYDAKQAA